MLITKDVPKESLAWVALSALCDESLSVGLSLLPLAGKFKLVVTTKTKFVDFQPMSNPKKKLPTTN